MAGLLPSDPVLEALLDFGSPSDAPAAPNAATAATAANPGPNRRDLAYANSFKDLAANGIFVVQRAATLPLSLKRFLQITLRRDVPDNLSPVNFDVVQQEISELHEKPTQERIASFRERGIFPVDWPTFHHGQHMVFGLHNLPQKPSPAPILHRPTPHRHFGYNPDIYCWDVQSSNLLGHPDVRHRVRPTSATSLPFFLIMDEGPEPRKLTLDEAARAGACCVNAMRWLLRTSDHAHREPATSKTVAFSAIITYTAVDWYVHWYDPNEGGKHYMTFYDSFNIETQLEACRNLAANLAQHCSTTRIGQIRRAIAQLNTRDFFQREDGRQGLSVDPHNYLHYDDEIEEDLGGEFDHDVNRTLEHVEYQVANAGQHLEGGAAEFDTLRNFDLATEVKYYPTWRKGGRDPLPSY